MNDIYDIDIIGEVIIPSVKVNIDTIIKNSRFICPNIAIKELLSDINNFRSTLFQGENLNIIICLKSNNIKELLEYIKIKIDIENASENISLDVLNNNINEDQELSNNNKNINTLKDLIITDQSSCSTYNIDSYSGSRNSDIQAKKDNNYACLEYDRIKYNKYISYEDNNKVHKEFGIIIVSKQINVPSIYISKKVLFKINLLKKNFIEQNLILSNNNAFNAKSTYLSKIFDEGSYVNNSQYIPIKTLFKEVTVLRPIELISIKQLINSNSIDIIQFRFKNITQCASFSDFSLINSKFVDINKNDINNKSFKGMSLKFNDFQVLREETKLHSLIEYNQSNNNFYNKQFNFENISNIVNTLEFDLVNNEVINNNIINPGEEFTFVLKITGLLFNYKISSTINKLHENYVNNLNKNIYYNNNLLKIEDNIKYTSNNPSKLNKLKSYLSISSFNDVNILENQSKLENNDVFNNYNSEYISTNNSAINDKSSVYTLSKNNINKQIYHNNNNNNNIIDNSKIITQNRFDQSILTTKNNISTIDNNFNDRKSSIATFLSKGSNINNMIVNNYNIINTVANFLDNNTEESIDRLRNKNTIKSNNVISVKNASNDLKAEKDSNACNLTNSYDIVKLKLMTPVLLSVLSNHNEKEKSETDNFNDNLFVYIPFVWNKIVVHNLNIIIILDDIITIHQEFKVIFNICNTSKAKVDLVMNIEDETQNILSLDNSIIIGELEVNQKTTVEALFIGVTEGHNKLPKITIIDSLNNNKYRVESNYRILVNN